MHSLLASSLQRFYPIAFQPRAHGKSAVARHILSINLSTEEQKGGKNFVVPDAGNPPSPCRHTGRAACGTGRKKTREEQKRWLSLTFGPVALCKHPPSQCSHHLHHSQSRPYTIYADSFPKGCWRGASTRAMGPVEVRCKPRAPSARGENRRKPAREHQNVSQAAREEKLQMKRELGVVFQEQRGEPGRSFGLSAFSKKCS